jgi:hypothetical protein
MSENDQLVLWSLQRTLGTTYEPAAALHRTHHRRVVFFPRIHLVKCITSKFRNEGVVPVTVRSRDHMGSSSPS